MSPKPFSKTRKPQTIVDSIVHNAMIICSKLHFTANRHSVVLWLDNFDHIELFSENGIAYARYFKRNLPGASSYNLTHEDFAMHVLFNHNAFDKLNSLANDIVTGKNTMIARGIKG